MVPFYEYLFNKAVLFLQTYSFSFQYCVKYFRCLRPDFSSNLVHGLAFGTPKLYIAPCGKTNHELISLSYYCDVKSGLSMCF